MNYKELSRRCVEIEEEGMACGPISMLCVASEAVLKTEEGVKYLTVEWISEVPDSVSMIISSQSIIELLERGDMDEISQVNENSKIYSTMDGDYKNIDFFPVFQSLAKDVFQYLDENDILDEEEADDEFGNEPWGWTKLFGDQTNGESDNQKKDMNSIKMLSSRCERQEYEEYGIFWAAGAPEETVAEMKIQDGDDLLYLTVEWNPDTPETLTFTESTEPLMDLLVDETEGTTEKIVAIRDSGNSWLVETSEDYKGKYIDQFKSLAREIYSLEENSRIDLTEFEFQEDVFPWIQDWAEFYFDLPSEDDEEDEDDNDDNDENWFV